MICCLPPDFNVVFVNFQKIVEIVFKRLAAACNGNRSFTVISGVTYVVMNKLL